MLLRKMSQRVDFPNMVITQLTEITEDPPTRCSNQMFTKDYTKLWLMQSYLLTMKMHKGRFDTSGQKYCSNLIKG